MSEEERLEEESEMSFWDHLSELAIRLRRIVVVTLALTLIYLLVPVDMNSLINFLNGKMDYQPIVVYLLNRIRIDMLGNNTQVLLIAHTFADPVILYVEAAIVMAIATALPYIAYEIYMFIAPGLYANEKKFLKSFIISFSILFIAGGIYGYYLIMPITFKILIIFTQLMGAGKLYSINDFYNFVFLGILANALFFTMPVFIVLAVKFNVITVDVLAKNKRYVYVIVMIITAILTPDPTPVSMLLLSIPFIALYELSLFFAKRVTPI